MRVVFLNPPSLLHDTHDLAPPLWALLLGAIAEEQGHSVAVLDLNLAVLDHQAPPDSEHFFPWVLAKIKELGPHVVCYSSMAVNSHVCLQLAELLREELPGCLNLFGGPHFSAIAEELLRRFPAVDAVFIGEAERSFAACLSLLTAGEEISKSQIPGVLTKAGGSMRGSQMQSLPSDVPKPAYHLVDLARYFLTNPRKLLDFEAGRRGCIYACRYCYAPQHFGRGQRSPSAERFVSEMADAAALGAKHLFIVHDNFVNYPAETSALCRLIAAARSGLTFNCYATLAQLDEEVVPALALAGCSSIYVGVDAVHPEARREFAKGLFRSRHDLLRRIDLCLAHGITPTLAFLLEEPERGEARFVDTVSTAMAAAVRGCSVTFNTLTIYPRTALAQDEHCNFSACNLKARICFDAPQVVQFNVLSEQYPHLFPFHSTHRREDSHGRLLVLAHALKTLSDCAAQELLEIVESGVLMEFLEWLLEGISSQDFAAMSAYQRRFVVINRLTNGLTAQPPTPSETP